VVGRRSVLLHFAGTIVLSFDNLGEASELERGTWPAGRALGRHSSVSEALPRLLDELERHRLSGTFFVEAINCELYPEALREIADRGHELGAHGWRHEDWAGLGPEREIHVLQRCARAFAELGRPATGFRPPGGRLHSSSPAALRATGFRWCSPADGRCEVSEGIVTLPFDWELVDAYHLMDRFGPLRRERGDPREPKTPEALAGHLAAILADQEQDLSSGSGAAPQTLILHPFLMLDELWWQGVSELLARLGALASDGRWVGPGGALADRLRQAARPAPAEQRHDRPRRDA
jgi:peptidoglycan/xylan/chitin deacetylase (PgdA/CDA1 family)